MDDRITKWTNCLDQLFFGNYALGWPEHEWIRSGNPASQHSYFEPTPTFSKPIWQGDPQVHLLLNADFGMGDTIQFFRFISQIRSSVKRLTLRCDGEFRDLFAPVEIADKDVSPPEFDQILHLMSLPKILGVQQISGEPYLTPQGSRSPLLEAFAATKFTKVGICWAGNPFNKRDHLRSIPVDKFQSLKLSPEMRLISLQRQYEPPPGFLDVRALMRDWNQTAFLIDALDLVISVDTSIAHLAGALGKETWLLIPEKCDWRWGIESNKTVWYDHTTLYRQKGAWDEVIERVRQDLVEWIT